MRFIKPVLEYMKEDLNPDQGEASVTFITDTCRFILIKRNIRTGDPWSGQMALPGGYRKKGESSSDAARRETYEEVGVRLNELYYIGMYESKAKDIEVKAFISEISPSVDPVAGDEVSEAFWVPISDLVPDSDSYLYREYRIWGMTFRILKDILE
jgi:8-oxo-dGTP diphosphatase